MIAPSLGRILDPGPLGDAALALTGPAAEHGQAAAAEGGVGHARDGRCAHRVEVEDRQAHHGSKYPCARRSSPEEAGRCRPPAALRPLAAVRVRRRDCGSAAASAPYPSLNPFPPQAEPAMVKLGGPGWPSTVLA